MCASHAINYGCLVVLACFRTASSKASFLGVHPSECQKYTEKTRNPPLTFTHAWAILPSLPGIESIAPSSTPPQLLPSDCRLPQNFLLMCAYDPHCLLFHRRFSLHPLQTSILPGPLLLNCSSISFFLSLCAITKKISHFPLYLFMCFFSVLQANPLSKVHLHYFASFFISVLSFPFGCLHPCGISSAHLPVHPYHCLRPSLRSFCRSANTQPTLPRKRRSHLPVFSRVCLTLGRRGFLPASLFFHILFLPQSKQTYNALFTPSSFSVLHLLLLLFLPVLSLLFLSLFLNSPPLRLTASAFKCALGPFPGCFLQRCWGPFPDSASLLTFSLHLLQSFFPFSNVPLLSMLYHRRFSSSILPCFPLGGGVGGVSRS